MGSILILPHFIGAAHLLHGGVAPTRINGGNHFHLKTRKGRRVGDGKMSGILLSLVAEDRISTEVEEKEAQLESKIPLLNASMPHFGDLGF